jgi:nucleoside-diphosphate-sugar epimerase
VPTICRSLLSQQEARITQGRQMRDFLDAREVGVALVTLLDRNIEGPVNVASGDGLSIADLVLELGALAGRQALIWLAALPERSGEPPTLIADIRRLRDEAEFQPAVSRSVRFAQCLDWWRAADFGRPQRQLSVRSIYAAENDDEAAPPIVARREALLAPARRLTFDIGGPK